MKLAVFGKLLLRKNPSMLPTNARVQGNKMNVEQFRQIERKQAILKATFTAWMNEKMKDEVVCYMDKQGNIVEHYPNGSEKIIEYAAK